MAMDASGGERRGEGPDWCVHEATLDEIDCLYGEHPDWHRRCVVFLLGALEAKVSEMNVGNRVCFETAKAYHIWGLRKVRGLGPLQTHARPDLAR